uniref:Uncharacterized protein n=1 Tax=Rhizophora mucronata TaxID=61149 RepID=A0A2P2M6W1_RHIMU
MELHPKIATPICQEPCQVNPSDKESVVSIFCSGFKEIQRSEIKSIGRILEKSHVFELLGSILRILYTFWLADCKLWSSKGNFWYQLPNWKLGPEEAFMSVKLRPFCRWKIGQSPRMTLKQRLALSM